MFEMIQSYKYSNTNCENKRKSNHIQMFTFPKFNCMYNVHTLKKADNN